MNNDRLPACKSRRWLVRISLPGLTGNVYKRDVGMVCQKYTNKGGYKSDGKHTKPCPYIFLHYSEDVGTGLCIFTFTFISSLVCVLFAIPSLHLFIIKHLHVKCLWVLFWHFFIYMYKHIHVHIGAMPSNQPSMAWSVMLEAVVLLVNS